MVQLSLPQHSKFQKEKLSEKTEKIKSYSMFIDGTENLAKIQK